MKFHGRTFFHLVATAFVVLTLPAAAQTPSLAGKNVVTGGAGYCASKAGLNAFSEVLLQEVRQDGIRVSYVCPGSVNTDFVGHADPSNDWKLRPEDVAQVVLDLLSTHTRSLPSLVELRPAKPPKK